MITRNFGRIQCHKFHHTDGLRFYLSTSGNEIPNQVAMNQQVCATTWSQNLIDEFVNWKNRAENALQCCFNAVSDLHLISLQFA